MAAIDTVWTDAIRVRLAELCADFSGTVASNPLEIKEFKLGIGNTDGAGTPLSPDPTFTDLDQPTFTKALTGVDVTDDGAGTLTIVCSVATGEANDTPDPEYTEVGVFNTEDVMILYATYGPEAKNSGNSFEFTFTVAF